MEKKYDVFISYSSEDQKIVEGICGFLEKYGIRCFVAYRDIPKGVVWAGAIVDAIDESRLMVVVFSLHFNVSVQTDREIELASENKIPILTYRINNAELTGAKKYYLKNLNWIDAFPNPENYFGCLHENICKLLNVSSAQVSEDTQIENWQENDDNIQENVHLSATQVSEELTLGLSLTAKAYCSGLDYLKQQVLNISSGLKYRYDKLNHIAEVIGVENEHLKALVIPSSVYYRSKKYTIVGIKEKAFESHLNFFSVKLPETITYIGSGAFRNCEELSFINIPENVEIIGDGAFEGCKNIVYMHLPSRIETIGHSVFRGCKKMKNLILPNEIKEIGSSAFEGCSSLQSIDFPSNIKSIRASAFARCGQLKSITIPNSVTEIGSSAFEECGGLSDVTLSCNIIEIRESVFQNCSNLRSIIIPSSVIRILRYAFLKCEKLEEVIMGNRIQRIGQSAFYGCTSLKKVVLPINSLFEHGTFPQTCEIIRK